MPRGGTPLVIAARRPAGPRGRRAGGESDRRDGGRRLSHGIRSLAERRGRPRLPPAHSRRARRGARPDHGPL